MSRVSRPGLLAAWALLLLNNTCVHGYLYPYETPSRETKSLDGLWHFKISPEDNVDIGFTDKWYSKDFSHLEDTIKMPVPSSFNDVTTNATIRDFVGWVWYQRMFYMPKGWRADKNGHVFLHFGSVHYYAIVFVNGNKVGEHEGGHLPFQLELPRSLVAGHNSVTVAVNNTLTLDTVAQGELRYTNNTMTYPAGYKLYSHDFDYMDYAGLNRPVLLFTTPRVYTTGLDVKTDVKQDTGRVWFTVRTSEAASCKVALYDRAGELVAQAGGCQGRLTVDDAQLWWPVMTCGKIPGYLYSLEVVVKAPNLEPDVYRLPVGIRTVTLSNSSVLINGEPVYLWGFGMHEDAHVRGRGFDNALMQRDLNLISWVGANSFRTSHYPYSDELMNEADALGLLVIVEAPACSLKGFGPALYKRHAAYVEEMIDVHKNRPSVIMWSLANEPVSSDPAADPYFGNLTLFTRRLDETRPITFVGSVSVDRETAAQHVDVICINRYRGWYSDSGHTDLIPYQVVNEMTAWKEKYGKPVLVTEYGADAVPGFHVLPETMYSEDYQVVTHLQHFPAFDRLREAGVLAGEMMWNFKDFNCPQEYYRPGRLYKGIFTRERQPKALAHVLRKRHITLANCSLA